MVYKKAQSQRQYLANDKVWLTNELRLEIKKVFEPRYRRTLSVSEVEEIAENLAGVVEEIVKLKWREKYDSKKGKRSIR